ncbi:MAG TPA: L-seryl-tRNA(Sec) selenium transferase [Bacillota bacterium]|nr:L-seryl-tRNA(Sec) selenium transferase [Bacillota bacterium]
MGLKSKQEVLSQIPQVELILRTPSIQALIEEYSHQVVTDTIRQVLAMFRREILSQQTDWFPEEMPDRQEILQRVKAMTKQKMQPSLHGVINATGIILHTNLGRALLPKSACRQVLEVASRYSNLEIDEKTGIRGSRYDHVNQLLCQITGAEDAMVVNNNAAAVLLVLAAMGCGKEVIVSRGQMIEIGGSFRIPEVMEQSGCHLVEIGATNKTHAKDYEKAIGVETAILLKAHTSNYRIVGFTEEVSNTELVELGHAHDLPIVEDLGSGILLDLSAYGLTEPTVQSSLQAGIDVVTISGDKLLGGPQAGIILGKQKYIALMKQHPLNRALRIDKMTLAGLEATLKLYLDEKKALTEIPVLRMLTVNKEELQQKADKLWLDITMRVGGKAFVRVQEDVSAVGGGSMPLVQLPTYVIAIVPRDLSVVEFEEAMRGFETPIFGRIAKDQYLLDVRTIQDDELTRVADGVVQMINSAIA